MSLDEIGQQIKNSEAACARLTDALAKENSNLNRLRVARFKLQTPWVVGDRVKGRAGLPNDVFEVAEIKCDQFGTPTIFGLKVLKNGALGAQLRELYWTLERAQ